MRSRAKNQPPVLLIADDDADDRLMATEAMLQSRNGTPLRVLTVEDGEELLDYLYLRGKYKSGHWPRPDLILMDLNMPRKNGAETLKEIKADPAMRHIPVIILTSSGQTEDIDLSYDLGVNSFITKPVTFDALVNTMRILGTYWFEVVRLPSEKQAG